MNQYLIFFLKAVTSSGIMFGYYCLALRNKKFHQYNRFYLLCTLIISIALPFLNFRLFSFQQKVFTNLPVLSYQPVSTNTNLVHTSFDWPDILLAVSVSITVVMLLIVLKRIAWIYQLKRRYPVIKMHEFDLIETDVRQAPFSFLNNLFWRSNIPMHEKNGRKIFVHELTHIREKHTYDKLFSQIVLCFFWVNPIYWFIQKELNILHEFIADSRSIQQGDTQSFAEMLLQSHNEGRYLNPSHSFFNSSIKRRIIMLTTSKNAKYSYLRRVFALPILLLVTILLSFKIVNAQINPQLSRHDSTKIDNNLKLHPHDSIKINNDLKLHPHDSLRINKVSVHERNDSLADVTVNYTNADGKPDTLHLTAGYSKNDFHKPNVLYDEETGERREVSAEETREIVKQIIQNPPTEDIYFVDGQEYSPEDIKKLDPEKIKTINVYTREEAVKRFGDKAKNGAIVFTTK